MQEEPKKPVEEVIREDGRYPLEAFEFLREGLNRAVKEHCKGKEVEPAGRHVTGSQICLALRDLALEQWGMLARTVLERWNIRGTIDFGNMVYLLIRHGFMRKTREDSIDHFRDVYDFAEAFDHVDHFETKQ